jgi:hypothetical protein
MASEIAAKDSKDEEEDSSKFHNAEGFRPPAMDAGTTRGRRRGNCHESTSDASNDDESYDTSLSVQSSLSFVKRDAKRSTKKDNNSVKPPVEDIVLPIAAAQGTRLEGQRGARLAENATMSTDAAGTVASVSKDGEVKRTRPPPAPDARASGVSEAPLSADLDAATAKETNQPANVDTVSDLLKRKRARPSRFDDSNVDLPVKKQNRPRRRPKDTESSLMRLHEDDTSNDSCAHTSTTIDQTNTGPSEVRKEQGEKAQSPRSLPAASQAPTTSEDSVAKRRSHHFLSAPFLRDTNVIRGSISHIVLEKLGRLDSHRLVDDEYGRPPAKSIESAPLELPKPAISEKAQNTEVVAQVEHNPSALKQSPAKSALPIEKFCFRSHVLPQKSTLVPKVNHRVVILHGIHRGQTGTLRRIAKDRALLSYSTSICPNIAGRIYCWRTGW